MPDSSLFPSEIPMRLEPLVRRVPGAVPWCAALLPALFLVAGCGSQANQARNPRVSVTVARVERRDMPLALRTTGMVEPVQSASVGSQVGGVVVHIVLEEGRDVTAGQALIQLDPRPFRAALDQAAAALARDRAQAEDARLEADRAERLAEQQLIAESERDQKRAQSEAWRGTVRADSAALAKARLDLEYSTIRAPIAGRTGNLNVHVGDLVKAATSEPLVTINQVQPVRVRFTVPQDQLPLVQVHRAAGPAVYVRASSDTAGEIAGKLVFVDNAVDPATGTLLLKGEFPNRDRALWPGERVEVRLVLAVQSGVIVVPAPAVTTGPQGPYVYVLNPDSSATPRPVRVGRADAATAIIEDGLQPGETVVTDGQFRISPGARLSVRGSARDPRP